ncbi:hypothetical protein AAW14_35000, partial [Streptomyces hygroscopicus]|nr:hypothetical protein [Streptomyces hygroscopicus]
MVCSCAEDEGSAGVGDGAGSGWVVGEGAADCGGLGSPFVGRGGTAPPPPLPFFEVSLVVGWAPLAPAPPPDADAEGDEEALDDASLSDEPPLA